MESTVSIEIGAGPDPAAVVHVAPGEKLPPGSPLGTPRPMSAVPQPAAAAMAPVAPPVAPRAAFEPGPTLPAIPRAAPVPAAYAPAAPSASAMPSRPPSAAGRPASILPPAATPFAP